MKPDPDRDPTLKYDRIKKPAYQGYRQDNIFDRRIFPFNVPLNVELYTNFF